MLRTPPAHSLISLQPIGIYAIPEISYCGRTEEELTRESVPYEDAVEEALCFGWIDSKGGGLDATRNRLYFSPRRRRSPWSSSNKARVERLIAAGLMRPAGLAAIEAAKASGSWSALDEVEQGIVPDDLGKAFGAHAPAAENFAAFPWFARRSILLWISQAKKPETRAARISEAATKAADNIRAR